MTFTRPLLPFLFALFPLAACGDDAPGAGGAGGSAAEGGAGGSTAEGGAGATASTLDSFQTFLTGRFDSAAQAAADPAYFAVQLEACPVDAPELGPRVLYIEQALLDDVDAPYRQRLYLLESGQDPATEVVSRVFELVQPARFVGSCASGAAVSVTADQALEREGCAVYATFDGERFVGGTAGSSCASDLNGASYATSEVSLEATRIESWDRGYDAGGTQVWGATAGPYVFLRVSP